MYIAIGIVFVFIIPLIAIFTIWNFFITRKTNRSLIAYNQQFFVFREACERGDHSTAREYRNLLDEFASLDSKFKELEVKIDELRIQIAILNGTQQSIPLPYTGAKRGPKPKKRIGWEGNQDE